MKKKSYLIKALLPTLIVSHLLGCVNTRPTSTNPGKYSTATGEVFNKKDGFQVPPFKNQIVGPGMVFIDGGSTIIGLFGEGVNNSAKKEVTIPSFYAKETEVTNIEWQEYLYDLKEHASPEEYKAAQLNDSVWVRDLAFNDPYVNSYSKHPGFRFYPVVGVTWTQAQQYCKWLTKYMNKKWAKENGETLEEDEEASQGDQQDDEATPDQEQQAKEQKDEAPAIKENKNNFIPEFRLLTEAEWEYAARAIVGVQSLDFVQSSQPIYPWGDGLSLRGKEGVWKGRYLANFKRAKGNYKGVPGESNSSAPTSYVYEYPPNAIGLYDMGGNVSEWVYDLYRPLTFDQVDDFNPIRRDDTFDSEKNYDKTSSLVNNKSRVYKGASWKDPAYWAQIGTRRYLDEDSCTATIGFRYAMNSMGDDYRR
jgi:gliding motility-associated lipoprotein GldJ